jgi:HD-GYP domain-containing protein (c-di-GMP phosphodiesterase class II)
MTIESKIIAVADSFDAMTSIRPYREAMTDEDALREIKSLSGTLYDPIVVQALEECLREGLI